MWIVVQEWSDYEVSVHEFKSEEEARKYFDDWVDETSSKMYLAKVEKTFYG